MKQLVQQSAPVVSPRTWLNAFIGNGENGDTTISGATTLSSDMYYGNLTIDAGKTLNTNGWRIFATGTITVNGTIDCCLSSSHGSAGANGTNGAATAGAAGTTASRAAGGGSSGKIGAAGAVNNKNDGTPGDSSTSSTMCGSATSAGGASGNGGQNSGASAGGTGQAGSTLNGTNYYRPMRHFMFDTLLDCDTKRNAGLCGAGGASGRGDNTYSGGAGGGGGASNPGLMIFCDTLIVNTGGVVMQRGGNGGNGGNGYSTNSGCGGGGGGASGSFVQIICNRCLNSGTIKCIGGTGGSKGATGIQTGATNGSDGSHGYVGVFETSTGLWRTNSTTIATTGILP